VTAPKGPSTCCIRKFPGVAYCGRDIDESYDQVFNDAAYAVAHYKNCTFLRACPDCVKKCEDAGVGQVQYLAPMATRDLKENNR